MEGVAYSGITEVATLLLLHRKGVDNLTNTKLHAKFDELPGDDPCTKIELSLEVNPTALGPLSGLLTGIRGLQGMHQLARACSTTPLVVQLLAYVNGTTTEHFTGTPSCDSEGSRDIRPVSDSSSSLPSYTGICITLQLPMDSSCRWACAKSVARYFHLLYMANAKVELMVSYHGNGRHKMVEYQSKDHMTINVQGHTLMTTLHPHYCYDPSLSNRRNKLHAVRGKKQMIRETRVRSGDTVTLQLSVACASVPVLPSLGRGKKLPADRLCKAIHMVVYGPGGVPVFPPSSSRGLLLSQIVNWEDYGVAIGNPCCTESTSDSFDQTVVPSFSNELVITKEPTRASVVERNSFLYVFLFIEAAVESVDVSSIDSIGRQLRSLRMLQHNLEDIQLNNLKQFRTAFHTSLNKLLCNYNSFSKINLTLEEAIPSVSEAVASIVIHSRAESFQRSCQRLMEVEPATGEEVQQWLTDRLWRIASHKLGAQYHNGQLIRAAEEPDTPDITAITTATIASHQPSLALHSSDDTLVVDAEEEPIVTVSRRRCYHPSVTTSHHHYYISQTDSVSSQTDCVMAADSFITLGSEDLEWSDTDCAQDSDITDDELWSDDNTVVNDGPLLWDNNDTHHTNMAPTTTPLRTTLACGPTNDDPLLQGEVLIPSNSDITTNEILKDTGSTNEITANDVSPNASSESNITSNIVIPIEAPSILTCDAESLTQDGTEAMESNSQTTVLLSRCSLPEDANTYFNELADLSSSPETVAENNAMSSSMILASSNMTSPNNMLNPTGSSIIEDQYLMEQLSTISSNEIDDDFVAEDLDWN